MDSKHYDCMNFIFRFSNTVVKSVHQEDMLPVTRGVTGADLDEGRI